MSGREGSWNFIEPDQLFVPSDMSAAAPRAPAATMDLDPERTSEVPKITRLPEGIEVIEQSVGRAIGNWILQVRCQCGRRWFESTPVEATHCPRCGMYVYIDVQPGPGPQAP